MIVTVVVAVGAASPVLPHAASSRTLQAEAQTLRANLSSSMTIPLRGDTHEPHRSRPVFALRLGPTTEAIILEITAGPVILQLQPQPRRSNPGFGMGALNRAAF